MLSTSQGLASLPAKPPSLLSRIGIDKVQAHLMSGNSQKKRMRDEDDEQPSKRRITSQEEAVDVRIDNKPVVPWLKNSINVNESTSREVWLHHELLDFVEFITPSDKERQARMKLVERITELIRGRWTDATVTLFGSSATGLELSGGDIDLVVAFDSNIKMSEQDKKQRLLAIGDMIRKARMTTWVNRILGARVPIIAFETIRELGEISVDISIRNDEDSGPRAIPVVKQYLQEMPALRTLIHAIKAFLSFRDLNDASQSTLSSYAITIMCISFLQRNPTRRPQSYFDDPFKEEALGALLMDFFRHYGQDFSYATHYISVTDKGIFSKKLKGWEPKGTAVLAVQCLLNPDNNITRGCSRIGLIVDAFQQAYHAIQAASFSPSSSSSTSLLGEIIEVPEETDSRRKEIESLFDSGMFSQALLKSKPPPSNGGRALSGGVTLSGQSAQPRNYRRQPQPDRGPRMAQALSNNIPQLPPLHFGRDMPNMNAQFHFHYQPEHLSFPPGMPGGGMPFGLQQAQFITPNQHFNNFSQRNHRRDGARYTHNRRY